MSERPTPMLDDLALSYVVEARQRTALRAYSLPVPGLSGEVQQVHGRGSHEIELRGLLVGSDARDQLGTLQEKVITAQEMTFTADIAQALELEKVVVISATFDEHGGRPGCFEYRLCIRESPPLPPPAELSPFGGLDGLDLGFDTDVLGDIADAADQLQDAVDQVTGALSALDALAGLGDLALGNPLGPFQEESGRVAGSTTGSSTAASGLQQMLGGES